MKLCWLYFSLCVLAASFPLRTTSSKTPAPDKRFPGWSCAPVPENAQPVALGQKEASFARDFPGEVAAFADGDRVFVVRWVAQPTRKLHPVVDCLRALGYSVEPAPLFVDRAGAMWSTCRAKRGHEELIARERIFADDGKNWTDVSAWYWHVLSGRSNGPWWSVVELIAAPVVL